MDPKKNIADNSEETLTKDPLPIETTTVEDALPITPEPLSFPVATQEELEEIARKNAEDLARYNAEENARIEAENNTVRIALAAASVQKLKELADQNEAVNHADEIPSPAPAADPEPDPEPAPDPVDDPEVITAEAETVPAKVGIDAMTLFLIILVIALIIFIIYRISRRNAA